MSLGQFIGFCAVGAAGCFAAVAVLRWNLAKEAIRREFDGA